MVDKEKIAAVYEYLGKEFDQCTITDSYEFGQGAQLFQIQSEKSRHKVIIKSDFLEKNSAQAIPDVLRRFLLAEHIRECNFPIVVTAAGLTD